MLLHLINRDITFLRQQAKQGTKENKNSEGEENEKPKVRSMAEDLKNDNNKSPIQMKAKLGDGSHIAAEDRWTVDYVSFIKCNYIFTSDDL